MATLYRFADVDGDHLAVFNADIPTDDGVMDGINIRTTRSGASLTLDDLPELIAALVRYHVKGNDGANDALRTALVDALTGQEA
jgi:hypothetical protein